MASVVLSDKFVIISCDLQLLVLDDAGGERRVSLASAEGEGRSVSCLTVSSCGRLLAVCDERKQVSVFSLTDFRNNSQTSL